jgi:hypothetical protein
MQARTFFRDHLCSEEVSVSLLSGRTVQALDGNLEEIGEWSALILTTQAVAVGTKVRMMGKAHELKGFVRSCTCDRLLGFFIDVGLDVESRWSKEWFVPEHMFALRSSMKCFPEPVLKSPEKFLLAKPACV